MERLRRALVQKATEVKGVGPYREDSVAGSALKGFQDSVTKEQIGRMAQQKRRALPKMHKGAIKAAARRTFGGRK